MITHECTAARAAEDATLDALDAVLRRAGLSWASIEEQASEVVLFGSRAAGLASVDSDWDLLLVGEGRRIHTDEIDAVWLDSAMIWSAEWLGSELASHVAAYGRWLIGSGMWRRSAHVSAKAATRKKVAVELHLTELIRCWPQLLPGARERHLLRLRREVQRLLLLCTGTPVPPTHLLDCAWAASGPHQDDPGALLEAVRASRYRV